MDWLPTLSEWPGPAFRRIVDALAADVATGRLKRGQQMPTHRALARADGIQRRSPSSYLCVPGPVEPGAYLATYIRRHFPTFRA